MSRSVNRAELLGHLGKDADVKYTPSGIQVATFSLATSRRYKPANSEEWQEVTDWHRCVFWRCDNIKGFLQKGKQLYVTGRMQTRKYDDRDGVTRYLTEVIVEELILLGGGNGDTRTASSPGPSPSDAAGEHGVSEDDVPF